MQCVPGFVLDPQTRRSTPPNQVRYPTDRQFVSGCSPPCLTATQLPSTTRSWLASTRTSTALIRCPLGRTDPGLRRDDDVLNSVSLLRDDQGIECRKIQGNEMPISVAPAEAGVQASRAWRATSLPIGVGEQYRCSPPSEPYGRFSRIRLSGQWLSTSRLALKSV